MQNLINGYYVGTPAEVKVVIATWEGELNSNVENEEILIAYWEPIIQDPSHTQGHQTLFRHTIQQYWVTQNLLDSAMIIYNDRKEPEGGRQEEPWLKDLQKEIYSVQGQQYHQNLCLKRMEKQIQTLL